MNTAEDSLQDFSQRMKTTAGNFAESAGKDFAITLDYSEASLATLDETINKYYPEGVSLPTTYVLFGAYVGEVVRRNLGGEWERFEGEGPAIVSPEAGFRAYVAAWINKRLQAGDAEPLAFKYKALKQLAFPSRDKELSPIPPASGTEQQISCAETAPDQRE